MELLLGLVVLFLLIAVPLLILKTLVGFVLWIALLPFKILGAILHLVLGLFGAGAKLLVGGMGLVVAILGVLVAVVLLPLLPLFLLGGFVWLLVRAARPRPGTLRLSA